MDDGDDVALLAAEIEAWLEHRRDLRTGEVLQKLCRLEAILAAERMAARAKPRKDIFIPWRMRRRARAALN
jgi:hypothetical protein